MSIQLSIITAATRYSNLPLIKQNIINEVLPYFSDVKWYIVYDQGKINTMEYAIRPSIGETWIEEKVGGQANDCAGGTQRNMALSQINGGWIYILDDDNIFKKGLGKQISDTINQAEPIGIKGFIMSQERQGGYLVADPKNVAQGKIDMGQFVFKREIVEKGFEYNKYESDYIFINQIYSKYFNSIKFVPEIICHYNYMRPEPMEKQLQDDQVRLLSLIQDEPVHFITGYGNIGDYLIYEGTRTLLNRTGIKYKEIHISAVKSEKGAVALICGGGAWCRAHHGYMPQALPLIEKNFMQTIVLPSSYEVSEASVYNAIRQSNAIFLCRERESSMQINKIAKSYLFHDHAFYFNYDAYKDIKITGNELFAFRTDGEQMPNRKLYPLNNDISDSNLSLHEWMITIAQYRSIYTDRAHVMVAAAMLGREVFYDSSNYHKLPGIVDYSLREFPVYRIP